MSWDDWDDDLPRPKRRRGFDDDLDLRYSEPPHSGAVTAAGVITIIMGALFLLCGVCSGLGGLLFTGVGLVRQQGGFFLILGVVYLVLGVGNLTGGIVTLQRHNWGRVFTLVCGTLSGLLALGWFGIIAMTLSEGGGLFGQADPDEAVGQAVITGFIALVYLAHAIFVYIVLLNSHNKEEFD